MLDVMRLANRFPTLLLRSPLHGLLSGGVLLLTFEGRRSGKLYTTPVNYVRDDDTVLLTTDSPWWKNLRGGAPVVLRLGGREVAGVAEPVTDGESVATAIGAMMDRFPHYGRVIGVGRGPDGRPDGTDLTKAIDAGRVLVRVRLVDGAAAIRH